MPTYSKLEPRKVFLTLILMLADVVLYRRGVIDRTAAVLFLISLSLYGLGSLGESTLTSIARKRQ